ncbi:MAG TPA: helix-turn-helix domain-containing protein [Gaiellaceae bacterium]
MSGRRRWLGLDALYVPAERRVLRRLPELADVYADDDGVIALTQEELGQIAGTTRATVNRVLREQEREARSRVHTCVEIDELHRLVAVRRDL